MHPSDYFKTLAPQQQQKLLDFWFIPWEYAHHSHHQGLFKSFNDQPRFIKNQAYIAYCQHFHLTPLLESFNLQWFESHIQQIYQKTEVFKKALEMLGLMCIKNLKNQLKADELRWCYQNSLARPIILNKSIPVSNAFELGMIIFHQMVQNFAQATWSRICLALPSDIKIKYSQTPLCSAPMLLIIQKHWLKIMYYIQV
jgi:hypothetical protein